MKKICIITVARAEYDCLKCSYLSLVLIASVCSGTVCCTHSGEHEEIPFYQESFYTAHAFGAVDGITYTNSQEAFFSSMEKGCIIFEVDVTLSSDGIPICRHFGNDTVTYQDFMDSKINDRYTPCDLQFLIDRLIEYPWIYFDLDIYKDKAKIATYIKNTVMNLSEHHRRSVFDRFIIECYGYDGYEEIASVYRFKNMVLTLSEWGGVDHAEVCKFMETNAIEVVLVGFPLLTREVAEIYKERGRKIISFTVNTRDEEKVCRELGCVGIQTDFLAGK